MGLAKVVKIAARLMRWRNPFQKGAQEASDQYIGKKSKLTSLEEMTWATDIKELAEADRESVAQFRAKKMGIPIGKSDGANKDSWVCDDMTINSGTSLPAVLLALVAGGAAVWWLGNKDAPAQPAPTPAVVSPDVNVPDTEYDVRFYDKDGKLIEVPRLPANMRSNP